MTRPGLHPTTAPARALLLALAVALAAALAAAPSAAAHDFWLEPADYTPPPATVVPVTVRVGDSFPGDPLPHRPAATVRFALLGAAAETSAAAAPGAHPAGRAAVLQAGDHALVFESTGTPATLPADRFEAYLAEEGLEAVSRQRAVAGESAEPGRELFARSVKALLRAGAPAAGGPGSVHTRPTGLPLELVPAASPYDLVAGDVLELVLLWHDEPLAGTLVEAVHRDHPGRVTARRTDAGGRVTFSLPEPGAWRLTAVHMERVRQPDADWRSTWTALTFWLPR